jgi:hypothetical protein
LLKVERLLAATWLVQAGLAATIARVGDAIMPIRDTAQRWPLPSPLGHRSDLMTIGLAHFQPIVALAAGVLILITPQFLRIIIACYLIFIGAIGLGVLD